MRNILSTTAIVSGALILCIGIIVNLLSENAIKHTLVNSRKIEVVFKVSSSFIENYQNTSEKLPPENVFNKWALSQPIKGNNIRYSINNFSEEAIKRFGEPKEEVAYLLSLWRGEWNEYYASWADQSTLKFDERDYYILNSRWAGYVLTGCISIIFLFVGWHSRSPITNR
jgi:hypothetical protein